MKKSYEAVVVGGGLTGIMAARTLVEKGINQVLLLEKEPTLGGRIATCRMDAGTFDYGAQFFTVRSSRLEKHVTEWLHRGLIKRWFGETYPRYTAVSGMDQLIQYLASDIDTRLDSKVNQLYENQQGFQLVLENGEEMKARSVILTPPALESKRILDHSQIKLSTNLTSTLTSLQYQPSLVALLTLHTASMIPNQGHLDQNLPKEIERIVDQQKKGISSVPAIGIYMKPSWSAEYEHKSDAEIIRRILECIESYIQSDDIQTIQLKRWKYSQVIEPVKVPYLEASLHPPLFIAGDAFLHPDDSTGRTRFESAYLSGISVAEKLYSCLV